MKKRILIFTLMILIIIIALASIPKVGYERGGFSPEELERLVIESVNQGKIVKLTNIKYNPFFWWPFTKTFYDKFSPSSQVVLAFLISLPYWIFVSLFLALIIEGFNQLIKKIVKK
jgi:hypothetical protein